jgi:hypothetical protein
MPFLPLDGEFLHCECGEHRKEQKLHNTRDQSNTHYKDRAGEVERKLWSVIGLQPPTSHGDTLCNPRQVIAINRASGLGPFVKLTRPAIHRVSTPGAPR